MSVFDCVSIMLPLLAYLLATNLSNMLPFGGSPMGPHPLATLIMLYIVTVIYSKIKCWSSKSIGEVSRKSFAPVSIFIGWAILFFIPFTMPIMWSLGNSSLAIIALSLLFKMVYDKVFEC